MTFTFMLEFSNCGMKRPAGTAEQTESCMVLAIFLPLGRCVGVQNPCALHPGADRGHAGGERLLLHGQGPPGEAVLDGEHQSVLLGALSSPETRKKKNNPPCTSHSKKPKDHLD